MDQATRPLPRQNSRTLNATAPCPPWRECASNHTGWHHSPHSLLVLLQTNEDTSTHFWLSKISLSKDRPETSTQIGIKPSICVCNKKKLTAGFNIVWSLYATVSSVVSLNGGNAQQLKRKYYLSATCNFHTNASGKPTPPGRNLQESCNSPSGKHCCDNCMNWSQAWE